MVYLRRGYNRIMTDIVVVYNSDRKPVSEESLFAMLKATSKQAVDGTNLFISGNVAFASQYFWVTPQEQGEEQPLQDETGRFYFLGNIRLDNRRELIKSLKVNENAHETISDAQLVLWAFRLWGYDCVNHLSGDFAFAIWEKLSHSLFMARDPLGVKNLAYIFQHHTFIAASEIEALLAYPDIQFTVNDGKIAEMLASHFIDQDESCYKQIQYLPPAHALLVSPDGIKKWRYWQIDPKFSLRYKRDEEYAEHLLEILNACIKDRLRTFGAVGVSMSGGLDSPSVAALAYRSLAVSSTPQDCLRSYSYAFEKIKSCDESAYIHHMLEKFPFSHHYVNCDSQWTLKDIETWPVYSEYPTSDPYPRLPLSVIEAAEKDGIKVLLSGYYGDTLFAGQSYWLADMLRHHLYWRILTVIDWGTLSKSKAQTFFHAGLLPLIPAAWKHQIRKIIGLTGEVPNAGLHPEFIERSHLEERMIDDAWKDFKAPGQWDRIRRLTLNIYPQGHAAVIKEYHKRGIQLSTPYWDRRLVEFVMALPAYQLGQPGVDRYVMRNAMKGILPEPIRLRAQRTIFFELFTMGIFEKEREMVKRLLENPLIVQHHIIRPEWLQAEFEAGTNWSADGYYFWKALSLELWLRKVYNEPLPER